jgi:hypothetical protein
MDGRRVAANLHSCEWELTTARVGLGRIVGSWRLATRPSLVALQAIRLNGLKTWAIRPPLGPMDLHRHASCCMMDK